MGHSGSTRFCPTAILALVTSACLPACAAEPGPASEKIEFSSPANAAKLPDADDARDRVLPFESLQRGNSMSGVLEAFDGSPTPAPLPQGTPNRRMMELWAQKLDQKKNWIYAKPGNLGDTPTAEGVMQIREYDPGRNPRHRDVMSEFFQDKADRLATSSLTPLDQDRSDSPVLPNGRPGSGLSLGQPSSLAGPSDVKRGALDNPLLFGFLPLVAQQTVSATNSSGSLLPIPTPGMPDLAHVPTSIRELLATPDGLNPLAPGFDPINLWADTTRQEINPVTPRRAGELSSDRRVDGAGALTASGTGGGDRPSALDEMAAKIMGPSSLAPAVAEPARSLNPTPGVLQLPTRKF